MKRTILTPEALKIFQYNHIPGDKDECWPFLNIGNSSISNTGYGVIKYMINKKRTYFQAHRISYLYYNNLVELEESIYVLHRCDFPTCQNPNHLFLGTADDNNKDRARKKRSNSLKGESNLNSIITEEIVRHIRLEHSKGMLQKELARIYGLDVQHINDIVKRKTWKHII